MMIKFDLKYFWVFIAAACLFAACAKDDEEDDLDTKSCFISGMTIGTLSRTVTRADSTVLVSVTGYNFPLTIDHVNGQIYNVDSLPCNTNVAKVVFSSLKAQGTLAIQSLYSGKDTVFVSTDSTDFRQPRKVTVYGKDGVSRRVYTISLRVHQEEGDSAKWQRIEGFDPATIPAATDCSAWIAEIQGLSTEAPLTDVCGVKRTSRFDSQIEEILVVGTNAGGKNVTWKKLVDLTGNEAFTWQQMLATSEIPDSLKMPELTSKSLLDYDGGALLVGLKDGQVECRFSGDFGRTWSKEAYKAPNFAKGVTSVKAWVDSDNFVWIYCAGTEETWRGRINRLGWAPVQKDFLKIRRK